MKKSLLIAGIWALLSMALFGQTTIFFENFEGAWTLPPTLSPAWSGTTSPADNVWHRNDYTTGWTSTSGSYAPGGANSTTYSARFHTYDAASGTSGDFISPTIDLSSYTSGINKLEFYHINTSGTDALNIYYSTNDGSTWSSSILTLGVSAAWTKYTVTVPSTSALTKIKFTATSDYGTTDIGVDEFKIINVIPLVGTKTIDPAGSGPDNYFTFTAAINALNASGAGTGGVTFNVASGNTFTENPPIITATGTAANPVVFQKSGISSNPVISASGGAGTYDAGIVISGGDYFTFDGIDISAAASTLEHGFLIRNGSGADGAQYNTIKNSKITLDRTNTTSKGILQSASTSYGGGSTPTANSGTNSYNKYYNVTIENSYSGIWLYGYTATYFDAGNEIGNTGTGSTTIGAATANDIGNGTTSVYGIYSYYQSGVKIFNTEIRNLTGTGTGTIFGINAATNQGICAIYNNKIHDISSTYTATGAYQYGIYVTSPALLMSIYNNVLYNFSYALSSANATLYAYGIYVSGSTTCNLYYNSVRMNLSANVSNAALYTGITTCNLANNILSNFSTAGATSKRYCYYAPTAPVSSSNNLFFIDGAGTNNFVGYGGAADRASLQVFAASISPAAPVYGLEGGSANADPNFTGATDLTFAGSTPARSSGTPVTGITTDINGIVRDVSRPTIGAYETTQTLTDKSAPVFSNLSITNGLSPVVGISLTDNSSSVNNSILRLWYRLQGSAGPFTGLDADVKPVGAMNGSYTWNTSLAALPQGTYQFYIAARDDQGPGTGIWVYPMWASSWAGWAVGDPPNFTANPDAAANINTFIKQANLAAGSYEVGDDQPVLKKLTDVAAQLNSSILLGNVTYLLNSTYDGTTGETYPVVFNQYSTSGGTWTVTIQVKTGTSARTTSGTTANPLIRLNGADNITFDGRAGGTGSTIAWTIKNTNTGGNAFTFLNDAQSNTIQYCDLISINNTTTLGVIIFGTTTGTSGNDNNTVTYCNIHDDGTNFPLYGIYSSGTTTTLNTWNSGITISNNNIYNFYINGGNPVGIYLAAGSTQWTVTGNSFYQTATRTPTTATGFNVILMGTGDGHTVSSNYLGGSAPSCGGSPWTVSGTTVANFFYGIRFGTMLLTNTNSIQGNTVSNISLGSNPAATGTILFDALLISSGICNIGNITPNIVGSGSSTGAITIAFGSGAFTSNIIGLDFRGPTGTVQNNVVGGFTISGASTSSITFSAFYLPPTNLYGTFTVSGNTVGSSTTANSIQCPSSATTPIIMYGIYMFPQSGYGTVTVNSNTVANITNNSTNASSLIQGIRSVNSYAPTTLSSNTIRDFLCAAPNTGTTTTASMIGIYSGNTYAGQTITQNSVYNLSNTTGTAAVSAMGIYYSGPTTGTNTIERNLIHSFSLSSTSTTATLQGIYVAGGMTTVKNNMVRLGITPAGGSLTTVSQINGIYETSGTNNFYNNSVYIGGTGISGATGSTYCLYSTVTLNNRNYLGNIFFNARSGGTTGKHYAIRVAGSGDNPAGLTSNYNLLLANGATGGTLGYYNADRVTMADWKVATGMDMASGNGDPNFVNPTGTSALVDLHVQNPTPIEAAGIAISSVTDDYDGQTRSTLTPPDIGADAGNFTSSGDIFGPNITYTVLGNGGTSNRSLPGFATITDNVGVSGGSSLPRLYYKKSTDNNAFVGNTSADNGWKYVVASNANSPYDFTVNYAIINGGSVSAGNIIQYFVVAQDAANNLSSRLQGATASGNPPVQNINGAPAIPHQYTITGTSISGTVTVPGTYPTLTGTGGLFEAINNSTVTGNIVASITADLTEPGTFALNQFNEDPINSSFTLTIQPDGTTERLISGAVANGMIRLDGADRVTIDGRSGGSGRYLRFRNTNTSNPTLTFINDATNNTIRNCYLEGASTGTTSGVILFSTAAQVGNISNTLTQNVIRDRSDATGVPYNLVYSSGTAGKENANLTFSGNEFYNFTNYAVNISSTGNGDGMVLTSNSIYQTSPMTTNIYGISISAGNGHTLTGNNFGGSDASRSGAALQTTGQVYGMYLSVGFTSATSVQGNFLSNFGTTGTGTTTNVYGIYVNTGLVNIGTVSGNTCGGGAQPFDTIRNGYDNGIIYVAGGIVDIQNNLIGNVAYYRASGDRTCGIYAGGGKVTIKNNIVRDLESNSTGTAYLYLPVGISFNSTIAGNIEGNTIYNIQNTNTGTTAYTVAGIIVYGASVSTTVHKNKIYNISALGAGTGTSSPQVYGIYVYAGSNSYFNNLISLGQGTDGESRLYGIQDATTGANNYYFNSVNVFGTGSGSNASYGFLKSAASLVRLNDNIFYNGRSGGSIKPYAVGATSTVGFASNYNNLYSASSPLGLWGAADQSSLPTWQATSLGDGNSTSVNPNFFSNTDLRTCQPDLDGAGIAVAGITTDYAGVARGNPPDIGAYEFSIPVPTITGATPVCAGTFGVIYTTESGMTGYSWAVSAGGTITAGSSTNTITVTWNTAGAQTVSVNYSNANGCSAATPTVKNVTVNPLPVPTISGPATACYGATGNVYTTENAMTGYAWTVSAGGTVTSGGTATDNTVTVTWNASGSQSVSVNYYDANGCTAASATQYNVTVYPAFSIGSISANQSICYNTTPAQLTGVAPTGGNTPYGYQWQSSTDNVTFTDIGGATTLDYQPGALTQTTYYRQNQTSASGCGSGTTNTVTITVYGNFTAGTISADQSICYNTTPAQLTGVAPTGGNTPYTYQWQSSTDNVTFTDIPFATNLNYSPGALTQTTYYRLNQTSASSCGTVTTNTVTITVYPQFVAGSISADQSICYNTTPAQLTGVAPTGGNTPYTYQWQSSTDNVTFTDIPLANSLNYSPGALTQTTYYKLKQTSASSCGTVTTNTVTITVYPQFVVGSISADQSICYNTSPAQLTGVAPTGGNTPYAYQWQSSTDNVTFTDIPLATNLNHSPGALTQTTYFRLNQTSASSCGTLTTNTVTITVYPQFVVGSISANQSICYNTIPAKLIGVAPTGGNTPYTYQWQSSTDNVTFADIPLANALDYQPGALTQTTYYKLNQTSASSCGTVTTNTVTITVNALPVPVITGPTVVCPGYSGFLYTTATSMTGYTWTISGGGTIDAGQGTNQISVSWNTSGAQYVTVTYTDGNGCNPAIPTTYNVTVNAVINPTITGLGVVCEGTTGVTYTTDPGNSSYSWTISAGGTITAGANAQTATVTWNTAGGQSITVTYVDPNGCAVSPTTKLVTVNALPVPSISGPTPVCYGTSGNVYSTQPGMTGYTWVISSGGTITAGLGTNQITVTWNSGGSQNVSVNYTNSNGCTAAAATNYPVTVYLQFAAGTISANQSICYNTIPAQLTGTAPTGGNTPYTYQWQSSTDNVTFTDIPSATGLNYTPGALTQTTYYRMNQTSASGCGTVTTNTVTVTVYPNFVAGSISASQSICYNTIPALLTGTAPTGGNTPYTYQWQNSTDNITFTNISGATSLTYQPPALTVTTYYRLNQTSASGCGTVTTNTVTITVYGNFVAGTISANQSICYNTAPALLNGTAPTGGNTPYTYQWQNSTDNITFTNISGATSLTYQPPALTVTTYYRMNQTSASGCGTVTTNTVTITVYGNFVAGTISASQSICYNTAPALLTGTAPTGGNTPYTYQWQNSTDNVTFTNISGATSLTYQPPALTVTTYYRMNQTSASGCGTVTTNTVTITVYGNFVAGTIAASQSICYNTIPALLTGTAPTGGNTPYTYQWQNSPNGTTWTNITGATSLTYQPPALTSTTYYRMNQTSASGCGTVTTNTVTITVYGNFVAGTIAASQSICYNTIPALLTGTAPTGGNTPYTYQWQNSPNGTTWTNIAGATSLTYQPPALTSTTYYRMNQTSASGCGTVTTNTVTITVYGNFVAGTIAASQSICYNTIPALLTGTAPTGGNTPYTYQWQNSPNGATWTNITGATSLTYQPPALTSTTYYRMNQTSASGCGTVTTNTVTITVYGNFVAGTIAASQSICYNTIPALLTGTAPTGGNTPYTYQWQNSPNGTTWTNIAGATSLTYQPPALLATTYYRMNQTSASGCGTVTTNTVTITVNPLPTPTLSGPNSVCAQTAGNVYTTQAGMTNYIWSVSAGGTITAGGTSTSNTVTVTWNTVGAQTVSVNYTNANGCTAASPTVYNVTVKPLPTPTINGDFSPCVSPQYVDYYTEAGMYSYQWTVSAGGTIYSGQGTYHLRVIWNIAGVQSLGINYTNAGGCSLPAPYTVPVFVSTVPAAAGAITGSTSVCAGASGVAYSTTTIQGATSYTWTLPPGGTIASGAGTTSITVNFAPNASSGNVTVAGTNQCGNGTSSSLAVTVNPMPAAAGTITGTATVCQGAQGVSYAVPTIQYATGYVWSLPPGATIASGANTKTITVNFSLSASSGAITVYGTNACGNGAASPDFNVTVNDKPPTPVITLDGVILTSSAPAGNQWYFNGTAIPGATGQTYEATASGDYYVIVTLNGCSSDPSNTINVIMTGITPSAGNTLTVYPVPNEGLFTVSLTWTSDEILTLEVYTYLGVRIHESKVIPVQGKAQQVIDLRPVPNGVYTVVLRTSDNRVARRILVNK